MATVAALLRAHQGLRDELWRTSFAVSIALYDQKMKGIMVLSISCFYPNGYNHLLRA